MQRLYSAFANSLPGFGLLLLRTCVGTELLYYSVPALSTTLSPGNLAHLVATGAGALVLVGWFTPAASAVATIVAFWTPAPLGVRILLAVISGSLALLGPGAWSIDAMLYGRRRIDLDTM